MTESAPCPVIVLRPQPGADATVAAARAKGIAASAMPLFQVAPCTWPVPDPADYRALLLTSANAVRHSGMGLGGAGLDRLAALPAWCVGDATAAAARAAGLRVELTGDGGVDALLRQATALPPDPAGRPLLWLAGADHRPPRDISMTIDRRTVYQAITLDNPIPAALPPALFLVHSPRAAGRLAALIADPARHSIVAISAAAADAAGPGWQTIAIAAVPTDAAVLALAAKLCQNARFT